MARVQLITPDEDRDRFVSQARREGLILSAWLRAAARERLEDRQRSELFESPAALEAFFRACDALHGPETEPAWDEHLSVIAKSRPGAARHPMTASLKPYPAYKLSGVEWLGDVPAHWEVSKAKHLSHFVTSGPRGWAEYYIEEGSFPCLHRG